MAQAMLRIDMVDIVHLGSLDTRFSILGSRKAGALDERRASSIEDLVIR